MLSLITEEDIDEMYRHWVQENFTTSWNPKYSKYRRIDLSEIRHTRLRRIASTVLEYVKLLPVESKTSFILNFELWEYYEKINQIEFVHADFTSFCNNDIKTSKSLVFKTRNDGIIAQLRMFQEWSPCHQCCKKFIKSQADFNSWFDYVYQIENLPSIDETTYVKTRTRTFQINSYKNAKI